jgi:acyl dehydratase
VTEIRNLDELRARVGHEVGVSEWMLVDQDRINAFADTTEDRQWIHVDPARAKAETPFGSTIAHGFLTLSLISALLRSAVTVGGLRMAINYGLNRVRFVAPVPTGSRIRARVSLGAVQDVGNAVQATWAVTVEREGADRPVMVAEWLVRYYDYEGVESKEGAEQSREGHGRNEDGRS